MYALIVERVRALRLGSALSAEGVGSGVDCGSMISSERFQQLEDIVNDARDQGARVEHGGMRMRHPYLEHGAYFTPTVIGDVTNDMNIAQREREHQLSHFFVCSHRDCLTVFAPVALLMPYETIDEAIAIANGTKFGLGASVFGPDQYLCMDVAKRLQCGMVSINDFGVTYVRLSSNNLYDRD